MNLPRLAVQRPVTTLMGLLSIMVIGGIAVARLPLAFLPTVDLPQIGVQIPYPNSNPTQIEKEITKPVEEVLSTLAGVKKLSSTSTADSAEFQLEFNWGQSLDVVRMQVGEKLDQVKGSLPPGIGQILIFSFNTNDIPVVEGRISAAGVDLSRNYDLLETRVVNRIRRVPGVARVALDGVAPREVRIQLILDRIKEHRVDVGALMQRLSGSFSNVVVGPVSHGGLRYMARALGAVESLDAIRDLEIDDHGLRLSDVATVVYEEPPITYGRHLDRQYAVALNVFKESTANTVDVASAVMRVIQKDINQDPLLKGVKLFVWQDQAKEITSGIDGLKDAGLVGALLAVIVLYFFLRRIDSTLIVSFSIPFSIVAACGLMYFMGKNLNILSMMGLMLGVGMLVDNAIVVLESIDRRNREEHDPKNAALEGTRAVAVAVISSTLTSVIVFLPLIVGAGTELTTWLKEVGITISIAILCSLLSSLTLIPLMSAHLLSRRASPRNRSLEWLEERYVGVLAWTLRHRAWTCAIVVLGLVVGLVPFLFGLVDFSLFSGTVNKRLFLQYEFSDFAYKADAEKAVNQVESYLFANEDRFALESVYSVYADNEARTVLTIKPDHLGDRQVKELRQTIRAGLPQIPGARVFFREEAEEGGSSTYFSVKFFGQDSEILQKLAQEAERRLQTVAGVEDVATQLNRARREVQVVIDRDKALRNGLTAQDISDIFAFTLGGMRLRRFNAGNREVETWLELRMADRENLDDLKALQINGPEGRPIQLGDIASFQVIRREQQISRENRKVKTEVSATYEGKEWPKARQQVTALMDAFDFQPGYSWSWDDRILEQGQENQQMVTNVLLALVMVYLVMASLFESMTQPFAILLSIPFALPGVSWLLAATRTPFNLMAWIGLLILIGIVVNNGIVLLDHMNQLRRAGVPRDEAVLRTGRDRLRAILMTAITTIVGLIPLAFVGSGVGDVYYYPLARTVMGGMISSTFLTLIVLPYINLGVESAADWLRRLWAASAPRAAAPVAVARAAAPTAALSGADTA
ncbi:MAG TPA: efflux RND transporter permease subunit [Candidatus Polarisedimenticolia bacterium]|nr:efflux RND transporter permease subunit [Candidatus Polarisedimenticolia bacterium]